MIVTKDEKILEVGDKIKCQNMLIQIGKINYQDYDRYHDEFIVEFYDIHGNIRNWHQSSDGGIVIPRPLQKDIWIGFVKNDEDEPMINNYTFQKIFYDEISVTEWYNEDIKNRHYKYCGKVDLT